MARESLQLERLRYSLALLVPTVKFPALATSPLEREIVREFQRERLAKRYNRQANDLLMAWCAVISAGQPVAKLAAFGIQDGVDATFAIGDTTAYSRRLILR